jgi:hypothetical protein
MLKAFSKYLNKFNIFLESTIWKYPVLPSISTEVQRLTGVSIRWLTPSYSVFWERPVCTQRGFMNIPEGYTPVCDKLYIVYHFSFFYFDYVKIVIILIVHFPHPTLSYWFSCIASCDWITFSDLEWLCFLR